MRSRANSRHPKEELKSVVEASSPVCAQVDPSGIGSLPRLVWLLHLARWSMIRQLMTQSCG
ncbi:hypothetical protein Zm00014a_023875 [Zea mays]|uniref:Uncharacterized protein n=1 Tax=Zea mays TaxID=4577 RepID=A0A3L6E0G6_MAIZE|nr:hypothetical protein Zm00014a_023875 [Zea mays]